MHNVDVELGSTKLACHIETKFKGLNYFCEDFLFVG